MNYYLVNIANEVTIMTRKVKFVIFACIVAAGLFLFYYWASDDYVPDVAQYQVNHIIRKHDTREINQVATNRKQRNFYILLKLVIVARKLASFKVELKNVAIMLQVSKINLLGFICKKNPILFGIGK